MRRTAGEQDFLLSEDIVGCEKLTWFDSEKFLYRVEVSVAVSSNVSKQMTSFFQTLVIQLFPLVYLHVFTHNSLTDCEVLTVLTTQDNIIILSTVCYLYF